MQMINYMQLFVNWDEIIIVVSFIVNLFSLIHIDS